MTKRFVSLALVFTILLTLFIPFSPTVVAANDSMTFLPAQNNEDGIQLQWKTFSSLQAEENFTLIKNAEETPLSSVELIESTSDQDGNLIRTYQLVDQQVVLGEKYTYTVKRTGDVELQTEPIEVTYQHVKDALNKLEMKITNVTDQSIKLTWSELQEADRYHLVVNGQIVEQFEQAGSYELKDLDSQTSYSISIRAIGNETMIKEVVENVTTAPSEEVDKNTEEVNVSKETVSIAATEPSGELVTIPDSALKRAIKAALQLKRDEIYLSDMESLTTLDASYKDVKDITGLEKATNLTKVELAGNEIKDASALQALIKLEYLDLSYYQGENVQFLSSLSNLNTLILADSSLKNLAPISALPKVETLDISFTGVQDIAPLSNLTTLKDLNISYIELTTILPLQQLTSLETLSIYGELYFQLSDEVQTLQREGLEIFHDDSFKLYVTSIKANEDRAIISWEYEGDEAVDYYKVTVAEKVTKLDSNESPNRLTVDSLEQNTEYNVEIVAFNKQGEQIGNTSTMFKTLPKPAGEKVVFKDAQLEKAIKAEFGLERDLFVSDMESLEELYLDRKRISDLSGLEVARNLKSLSLSGNKLTNFTALNELTNLISLNLGSTGISDLSVLSGLQNLNDLFLDQNNLESLETLPNLENLKYFSIYDNNLKNLKGIEKLAQLEYLLADDNPIESITEIQHLSKLRDVNLSNLLIDKIDVLLNIEELEYLSLYGNENLDLSEESAARQVIDQLEQRGVYVDYEGSEGEWFEAFFGAVTENSLHLYWDYYGEQEIAKYEVYVNGKLYTTTSGEENNLKIEGLEPNTEYEVEVKAYNADGDLVLSTTTFEITWDVPQGDTVPFKDNNLKELIKEQLGIERDPVESDLEKLSSLYLFESDIKDLSGLEYASNLYDFYLYGNAFTLDLAPLKDLQELYFVYIDDAPIKSYSILKEFKNVNSLTIVNNNLSDISFLSGMKKVQDITLNNNSIQDISALSSLTKLNFINLANNSIEDLTPLSTLNENLFYLDVSGNPIKDISGIAHFESLFELILDETMISDLTPLLSLSSLEYVSLYNISTLDLSEGTENYQVIEQLKQWGVRVNVEVDNNPELYIDEVTETSIAISWDPMLPKGIGSYQVSLYSNFGEELVEEIKIESGETSYQFTELSPFTDYYIEVIVEDDEYYGYLFAEVTTLPIEGTVKDVSMYVYKTTDVPEVNAMFGIQGIDEETENVFYYGWSDEQGRLFDYTADEPVDIFELPIGNYEITFLTEEEEELIFEFEINGTEDYLENPLYFMLQGDGQNPNTTPGNVGNGEDKEEDPQDPTPADGKNLVDPVKVVPKNELPKTATEVYNLLMVGFIIISFGGAVFYIQKRKSANNG
ncbi:MAG: fibronectin type III domain-containing protein [Bacillota bacterium]